MSLDDLKQAGVLLPEEEWGKHDLHTTVNRPVLLGLGAAAVASVVMMYLGDGKLVTWLGAGLFLLTLRFLQLAWKVGTGEIDTTIASHEAEDLVEEAAGRAEKEG